MSINYNITRMTNVTLQMLVDRIQRAYVLTGFHFRLELNSGIYELAYKIKGESEWASLASGTKAELFLFMAGFILPYDAQFKSQLGL